MAQWGYADVIQYEYGPGIDFQNDVVLADMGSGVIIETWNLSDPQPTISDLDSIAETQGFKDWNVLRLSADIDRDTANRINSRLHRHQLLEEQVGILRAQLVSIVNELGLATIPEFDELNTIASEEIQQGQDEKDNL